MPASRRGIPVADDTRLVDVVELDNVRDKVVIEVEAIWMLVLVVVLLLELVVDEGALEEEEELDKKIEVDDEDEIDDNKAGKDEDGLGDGEI